MLYIILGYEGLLKIKNHKILRNMTPLKLKSFYLKSINKIKRHKTNFSSEGTFQKMNWQGADLEKYLKNIYLRKG